MSLASSNNPLRASHSPYPPCRHSDKFCSLIGFPPNPSANTCCTNGNPFNQSTTCFPSCPLYNRRFNSSRTAAANRAIFPFLVLITVFLFYWFILTPGGRVILTAPYF